MSEHKDSHAEVKPKAEAKKPEVKKSEVKPKVEQKRPEVKSVEKPKTVEGPKLEKPSPHLVPKKIEEAQPPKP